MDQSPFVDKTFLVCKDHTVSNQTFQLIKDDQLDILHTFPKPAEKDLPEYYKSPEYISHTDSQKSLFDRIYQMVKSRMINRKLQWIENRTEKGAILDIGAGTGDFLLYAKRRGWEVQGSEPNQKARCLAREKDILLAPNTEDFSGSTFDVITLWHVLEHIADLDDQVDKIKKLLKPNGILILALPNFRSYDARFYKEFWAAYDVPRHLYHFSRNGVKSFFSRFDFEVIGEKGLLYDSFYVSLLSEKYKSGQSLFLRALLVGLYSNIKAMSSGEFSSVVYFLKKTE